MCPFIDPFTGCFLYNFSSMIEHKTVYFGNMRIFSFPTNKKIDNDIFSTYRINFKKTNKFHKFTNYFLLSN